MPRVILSEQLKYEHQHVLTVRATDVNYAGHLGNEALLGLVHDSRAAFMKALHFNTIVDKKQLVGLIIADLVVNFKAEAFAHETLTINSQIDEITEKSFRLFHRIRRGEQLIALVEAGVIAFSYAERKVVSLPPELLNGLQDYRTAHKDSKQGLEKPG